MSDFSSQPFLILDCQTTGMQPTSGRLLEIGWCVLDPRREDVEVKSYLLQQPPGEELPEKIQAITGLRPEDMAAAVPPPAAFEDLQRTLEGLGPDPVAVIHYAQFERSFLHAFYLEQAGLQNLPFSVLCSHRIGKRLYPGMPSQNIRGMAGFFGSRVEDFKRSSSHVSATAQIWRAMLQRLREMDITDLEALEAWMGDKPKKVAAVRYEYRMDRLLRLALPNKPGIYRMLAKDGRILYVGKATSLKSRVNSYFRGQKGRDRRKLEMLAQVWDLQVTECETPLEAALMETDEIKKWDPPYNVVLKTGQRRLLFYNRDFSGSAEVRDRDFYLGPYRPFGTIDILRALQRWLQGAAFSPVIFHMEFDRDMLEAGFAMYARERSLSFFEQASMRTLVAYALQSFRQFRRDHPGEDLEAVFARLKAGETADEVTPEMMAGKFSRLFLRAGASIARTRRLTRLLNADVVIAGPGGERRLRFRGGQLNATAAKPPWEGATIADLDRMSVLLSEVEKRGLRVEY